MKLFFKSTISIALVLAVMTSMLAVSFSANAVEVGDMPIISAGEGDFETTSFLSKADYLKLGMNLGSAQSMDLKPDYNPLLGSSNYIENGSDGIYYTKEVTYGWSNPQLVSVLMSAPYWNELYYGPNMEAAGQISFSLSTSYGTSSETTTTTSFGITFAGEGEVSAAGNGVVFGGSIEISNDTISGTVEEKSRTIGMTLSCGADKDNAVVCVVPLAIYKYKLVDNNKTSYFYVQAPVGTVYSVTSLANYNSVARSVNDRMKSEQMLEIYTSELYPEYTTGDPVSYFSNASDMPTSFTVMDGRLVPTNSNAEIKGEIYSTTNYINIGTGQGNAGGTLKYSGEKSSGNINGSGSTLSIGAYGGITWGFDMFGIKTTGTAKVGFEGESSTMTCTTEMNTNGIESSVTYINLPENTPADYSYSASQLVWYPTSVNDGVNGCPACIITSSVISGTQPPYLPDDLHVSSVTKDSVTLSWTNPKPSSSAYNRRPDSYNIVKVITSGNVTTHTTIKTVDAENESTTIYGLSENTSYSFALQAVSSTKKSVVGPCVDITTSFDSMPVITKQPKDAFLYLGETVVLSVKATPSDKDPDTTLRYQWQKLTNDKYGASFKDILDATNDTIELSSYDMDSTVYRCVVTQINGVNEVNTVSDCAKITYGYKISNYEDLCFMASKINAGHTDYVYGNFIVADDFSFPQGAQWTTPIGTGNRFKGTFDGQGHTISGLNSSVGGLFNIIDAATVKNLNLKDINITVHENDVGGICRSVYNASVISNCTVAGNINVTANVSNEPWAVAGICANLYSDSTIEECINYSNVTADAHNIAGVCASSTFSTVKNCANMGNIKGYDVNFDYMNKSPASSAGIVSDNDGNVENCYNVGTFSGSSTSHSIVSSGNAVNCYYLDTVADDSRATSKTAEQFSSGEVTCLLNKDLSPLSYSWFQNLDNGETADEYPTLKFNGKNVVFKVDKADKAYSNTPDGYLLGDTDLDGIISITDATAIQRHCAEIEQLKEAALVNADVDENYIISITDATRIQLHIAQLMPIK